MNKAPRLSVTGRRKAGCRAPRKHRYVDEAAAQEELDYIREHGLTHFCAPRKPPHRYYLCPCGCYHLTSMEGDEDGVKGGVGFVGYRYLAKIYYKQRVPMGHIVHADGKEDWVIMKQDAPRKGPIR